MEGLDEIPAGAATFDESYMDDESSEEDVTEVAAEDPNKFLVLCDGVLNSTSLLHESMNNFMSVKDTLLEHTLPPSVLLTLSITSSKLFRSITDLNEPIQELIRLVRIFSTPWEEKSAALKKMHEDFHIKNRQLDVAVRRLTLLDAMAKKIAKERRLLNWEKLYCKVTSVKGHGRRWKYTIEELKDRAKQGYDVLVHYVDQIEKGIHEPFAEMELRTESVAPQMDPIVEEVEEGSNGAEESGGEHFSDGSDSEESLGPETLQSGFSVPPAVPVVVEPPKPEVAEVGVTTHPPEYDVILFVRCFCPKGIEGRHVKCSITHGAQYEKTSRLDFTDEEIAKQLADAPPPKPKGPKRKGAPPPPPEPEIPQPVKYSELRFKLPVKYAGLREIPPTLEPLTVTVHVGEDEEIIGMTTVEVEDIEGCEMPEIIELADSHGQYDLSLQDSIMYTANAVVDAELQLAEPLPVAFPIYPLGGGLAGSEPQAIGSVPLFFYYRKIYKPKMLNRAIGTGTLRDLIIDEIGVDITEHTKESLFPETRDIAHSPMTVRGTPTPSRHSTDNEEAIPAEELEAILDSHQRDMDVMQQSYEQKIMAMHLEIERLNEALEKRAKVGLADPPAVSVQDGSKKSSFTFKKEKKEQKKIPPNQKLPKWGESLPDDFFERLEMFKEESEANRRAIIEHQKREESENIEKKLAFQHKAFRGEQGDVVDALKDYTGSLDSKGLLYGSYKQAEIDAGNHIAWFMMSLSHPYTTVTQETMCITQECSSTSTHWYDRTSSHSASIHDEFTSLEAQNVGYKPV
ncbi:hypothetical protein EB796_014832 [Bugula neritina]|uniref:Uncharacterized protein n=1 Tax=Bugula neritina TaxID=10212 RepID=A0A7J7JN59_BUGNE|nr:hypothetical protein EB796_014832 [Bugula neritina]